MKKCILVVAVLFSSLFSFAQTSEEDDFTAFRENVAITSSFTRNLDLKSFVKELKLVNYSKLALLPEGFGMRGVTYSDNGQQNDLVAGDGVYTSVDKFEITSKQAGNRIGVSVIVLDKIVADPVFKHETTMKNGGYADKIFVRCPIIKCGCPCKTFTCNACIWWGWSCLDIGPCVTVFEW